MIVGIDHGFSFPASYFQRYQLRNWDQFLDDFARHWPTDRPTATVNQFRAESGRAGDSGELRLTEQWTSSAKSVFQFGMQGSVAHSTHAGLPFLRQLRRSHPAVHCWPFDGWQIAPQTSVVAEVYPSLFRNRYQREGRSIDQQDAFAVSNWLCQMDADGHLKRFFDPPLTSCQQATAEREGWILGVY